MILLRTRRAKCADLMMRWLGSRMGWDAPDRDDIATISSAYSATEAGKSWVATEVARPDAAGQTSVAATDSEVTGGVLPAPGQPIQVARALLVGDVVLDIGPSQPSTCLEIRNRESCVQA